MRGDAIRDLAELGAMQEALSWDDVVARVEAIAADSGAAIDAATAENAREFVALAVKRGEQPVAIEKGYWPTISFQWHGFEVEVFGDHVETYCFLDDGRTDIRHFAKLPGSDFASAFMAILPSAPRLTFPPE